MGKLGKRKRQRQEASAAAAAAAAAALPEGRGHVSDDEDEEIDIMAGISDAELATTVRVVTVLGGNLDVFRTRPFKALRKAMHPIVSEQMKNYGAGSDSRSRKRSRWQKAGDDPQVLTAEEKLKQRDLELINSRQLRAARLKKLEEMGREGKDEETAKERVFRVPDGVALEDGPTMALEDGGGAQRQLADRGAEGGAAAAAAGAEEPAVLHHAIPCYTCKKSYRELHHFYDQLCPACAELNFVKRNQVADLSGKVCLVTGARVKIGYRCTLKLLRCGATVVATTRFPVDASGRFAQEPDFAEWKSRLQVYGLDFRDLVALERFCEHIKRRYTRLDVLVNNACQTIRRPPAYYSHMLQLERSPEQAPAAASILPLLASHAEFEKALGGAGARRLALAGMADTDGPAAPGAAAAAAAPTDAVTIAIDEPKPGAAAGSASAEMSQLPVIAGDAPSAKDASLFPAQRSKAGAMVAAMDQSGQQVDLRSRNSWLLKMHEVSVGEAAEVLAINTLAPFVLNARLRTMMERVPDDWKFVVNVSASAPHTPATAGHSNAMQP